MTYHRSDASDGPSDAQATVQGTVELIRRFDWDLMVTLTTREPTGPETLAKRYRELVRRVEEDDPGLALRDRDLWRPQDRLRHVLAWELQKREAWHLHALWAAPAARGIRREWVKKLWNRLSQSRGPLVEEVEHGVTWLASRDSEPRGRRRFEVAGIADVSLIQSQSAVAAYCAKYVAKGGAVEVFGLQRADRRQAPAP